MKATEGNKVLSERENVIVISLAHLRAYVVCVLNIGLLYIFLLIRPCFLAVYTTIAFKSYMPPAFSLRMFLVSSIKSLTYFLIFGAWVVTEGGEGGGGGSE